MSRSQSPLRVTDRFDSEIITESKPRCNKMAFHNRKSQIMGRCSISAKESSQTETRNLEKQSMQEIQKEQSWGQRDRGKELKDTLYWEKSEEIQEKYFHKFSGNEILH